MSLNLKFSVGDTLSNQVLKETFKCANMGGMRRSKRTNTLIIISDHTKGFYEDIWDHGILHYTGMGKEGDQVLEGNQNRTLFDSDKNGVEVHLFEAYEKNKYIYRGIVKLAEKPYQTEQKNRKVWIFPVRPIEGKLVEENREQEAALTDIGRLAKRVQAKEDRTGTTGKTTVSNQFYRDPDLRVLVKRIAEGKCQFCREQAPFIDNDGQPYLEEHHVNPLAQGGADRIENVVALCPNCHRRMHVLRRGDDIEKIREVALHNRDVLLRLLRYQEERQKKKRAKR